MKTLNKKHLKIINDLIFKMTSQSSHISDSEKDALEKKGDLSLEDSAFNHYLYWNNRLTSIELYEKYGICYFVEEYQKSLVSKKEDIIKTEKEAHDYWREAEKKAEKKVA